VISIPVIYSLRYYEPTNLFGPGILNVSYEPAKSFEESKTQRLPLQSLSVNGWITLPRC